MSLNGIKVKFGISLIENIVVLISAELVWLTSSNTDNLKKIKLLKELDFYQNLIEHLKQLQENELNT